MATHEKKRLGRRAVLRGLGGATVALPALDIMLDAHGEAWAQAGATPPKRYVVCFAGCSLGGDGDPVHNHYAPNTVGPDYDLKTALQPLAPVKSEVSVVSALRIPWAAAGVIPPGGRRTGWHVSTPSPLLSGTRSPSSGETKATAPTSDQIVAAALAGNTTFKSLVFRGQAAFYIAGFSAYGREYLSYRSDGKGGAVPIAATVSPKAAYDSLFFNFVPTTGADPAQRARFAFLVRSRKSVLDLVAARGERLIKRLGTADQQRLARHFDEIRDLERRISAMTVNAMGLCAKPGDPGMDPAIAGGQRDKAYGGDALDLTLGYSSEDQRARVFCDLIHMAFTCDLSRVASLMLTEFQSHMNMYPLIGVRADLHEVGHNGDPKQRGTAVVSKAVAWHVKHFAYLVGKLRDTPEGSKRLIDSSALVFLNEGGHGFDPEGGAQNGSHSSENMCCLIAGRAGGLRPGKHVVAAGKHPANVLVSAMTAVGVQGGTLGEVSGVIPELST